MKFIEVVVYTHGGWSGSRSAVRYQFNKGVLSKEDLPKGYKIVDKKVIDLVGGMAPWCHVFYIKA